MKRARIITACIILTIPCYGMRPVGLQKSRSEVRVMEMEIVLESVEFLIESVEKRSRQWENSLEELELQQDQLDLASDYLRQVEIDEKVLAMLNQRIERLRVEIVERMVELMNRAELRSA